MKTKLGCNFVPSSVLLQLIEQANISRNNEQCYHLTVNFQSPFIIIFSIILYAFFVI